MDYKDKIARIKEIKQEKEAEFIKKGQKVAVKPVEKW